VRLTLLSLLAAVAGGPLALAADLTLDGGRLDVRKFMASPIEVSVSGTPGLEASVLIDLAPGPVSALGESFPIGFTPAWNIFPVGTIPPGGTLTLQLSVPSDPAFHDVTVYAGAVLVDPGSPSGLDVSGGVSIHVVDRDLPLAGHALGVYPWFEYVHAVNQGQGVELAVEPSRLPELAGRTGDIYVVADKTRAEWIADPSLVDVNGAPLNHSFSGASLQADAVLIDRGTLSGAAGTGLGVGYDVVVDLDQDGLLGGDDLIDGYTDGAAFWVVHDLTQPGPLAVTEILYSGGTFLGQNTFYPTDIASMGELPLVVVSHGNGHNYQWYDHIGNHLASYGFVVMSHQNDTVPGIETASTTTLTNTDWFLGNLDIINGGVLAGHIDGHRITWIGHSRGGEGVARAFDRVVDGTFVPAHFTAADIVLISSIAPTGFLGVASATPHAATYHVWTGGADADVSGCSSSNVLQTFQIHDRAEQKRMSISLHGVGHGDFHNSTGSVASGPCLVGKPSTHTIMRGYLLALVQHVVNGNVPAKDYLTRQWEAFRPIGAPLGGCVVVDLQYRDGQEVADRLVLDDFQSEPSTAVSSSGGAVVGTVAGLLENLPDDLDTTFTNSGADPWNGFTYARPGDSARHAVFEYAGDAELVFSVPSALRDLSGFDVLSLRAAQATRHPFTTSVLGDLTFDVRLTDTHGNSSTIDIGSHGGGIEEPYQRTTCGTGTGWANEYETVRLRLTDFLTDGSDLDLLSIASVTLAFGPSAGSAQGRLGLDDLELTKD